LIGVLEMAAVAVAKSTNLSKDRDTEVSAMIYLPTDGNNK
jgi:hypothetical protein